MRPSSGPSPLWLATAVVLGASSAAHAYEVSLALRTIGQGYQERRFDTRGANEILSRRRLTQYLTLEVDGLEPASWAARREPGALGARVALRFDTDFGRYATEAPRGRDAIGELDQNQVDVLEAAFHGRGVGRRLDFELGRQLHFDALDFYAFDGLSLALRLCGPLALELAGGAEVRGERPLSSPIFELDGTSAGDRDPASQRAQATAWRPLAGVALAWRDEASPLRSRLAYRRSWSDTVEGAIAPLGPGALPGRGTNAEHVVAMAEYTLRSLSAEAGARYNLLAAAWDRHEVALRLGAFARQTVVLEETYAMPTFDGDSIWNVFAFGAFQDWRVRWELASSRFARFHVAYFHRHHLGAPGTDGEKAASRWSYGAQAGWSWRSPFAFLRCALVGDAGYGGRRLGFDLTGRHPVGLSGIELEGRLTGTTWRADPAVGQAGALAMAGLQGGAHYPASPNVHLHGLLEDNIGPYDRSNVRALVVLEVRSAP